MDNDNGFYIVKFDKALKKKLFFMVFIGWFF